MAKKKTGACRLCGVEGELSREHIPPAGAFNKGRYTRRTIADTNSGNLQFDQSLEQGGHFQHVLCGRCNQLTGNSYSRAYSDFAKYCASYATRANADSLVRLDMCNFYPLRVIKQVLVMARASSLDTDVGRFVAIYNPLAPLPEPSKAARGIPRRLVDAADAGLRAISEFVLDRKKPGLPDGVVIYCYLLANSAARVTGLSYSESRTGGSDQAVCEVAFWPLGWVVCFGGTVLPNCMDVSNWASCSYDEAIRLQVEVPCKWVIGDMPLDHRNPEEMYRAVTRAQDAEDRTWHT